MFALPPDDLDTNQYTVKKPVVHDQTNHTSGQAITECGKNGAFILFTAIYTIQSFCTKVTVIL